MPEADSPSRSGSRMDKVIRILVADDQSLFREGLVTLLSSNPDFEVVAEAGDGAEAVAKSLAARPDVVLMDLRMPVQDGVTAIRQLKERAPGIRVLILTTFDDDVNVFEGLRAGAIGYLLKDVPSGKLFEGVRAAARGEYFLQSSITAKVVSELNRLVKVPVIKEALAEPLSRREVEILNLVAEGLSNKEIADRLVIAEGTVKNHLTNILSKLSVRDRMQAVIKAREYQILGDH